jgi:hypothetical protein
MDAKVAEEACGVIAETQKKIIHFEEIIKVERQNTRDLQAQLSVMSDVSAKARAALQTEYE